MSHQWEMGKVESAKSVTTFSTIITDFIPWDWSSTYLTYAHKYVSHLVKTTSCSNITLSEVKECLSSLLSYPKTGHYCPVKREYYGV